MVYRYTRSALAMQGALAVLFLILAYFSSDWFLKIFSAIVGLVLIKDLLHCYGAEFTLDSTGLLEKSKYKERYRVRWDNLDIISKTYVNRRWIMLRGSEKSYYMLKPYIENYESLARDIILYLKNNRIKGVVIHEDLIKRLRLDIRLNSEGRIKFD